MISIIIYSISILCTLLLLYLINKNEFLLSLKKRSNLNNFLLTFFAFMPLIAIFTLRENVGTDYYTYETLFYSIVGGEKSLYLIFNHYIEPGWVLLTYISSFISTNFLFFKFLISSIFFGYLTKLILHEKLNYQLLLTFLVFTVMFFPLMNITRQILASIILIYSLKKYTEKKYIIAFSNVFIAFLIHKSALCFGIVFLLHYLYQKNITFNIKGKKITLFKIIEWLLILSPVYIIPVISILFVIVKMLNIESYFIYENLNININYLLYTIPIIIIYKYCINYYLKNKQITKNNHYIIYIAFLISILFQSLGSLIMAFERLSIYFFALCTYFLPTLLKDIGKIKDNDIYVLNYIYFVIYFIVMYALLNGQGCFPYKFI